jgi:hypothetical protein
MFTVLHKIDALQKAIEIVVSKNRHVFLIEDIEVLEFCLDELEKLKQEVIEAGGIKEKSKNTLARIIKVLDVFFGLADNILDFFEDLD